MSDQPDKHSSWKKINLGSEKLKLFFIKHLDRIYAAKLHLVSRLPSLIDEVQFADLRNAICETVEDVEKQIARMEVIYTLLDAEVSKGSIHGLTGLIEDAFEAINEQNGEPEMRDPCLSFFIYRISKAWRWHPSRSCKWPQ